SSSRPIDPATPPAASMPSPLRPPTRPATPARRLRRASFRTTRGSRRAAPSSRGFSERLQSSQSEHLGILPGSEDGTRVLVARTRRSLNNPAFHVGQAYSGVARRTTYVSHTRAASPITTPAPTASQLRRDPPHAARYSIAPCAAAITASG